MFEIACIVFILASEICRVYLPWHVCVHWSEVAASQQWTCVISVGKFVSGLSVENHWTYRSRKSLNLLQ